MRVLVFHNFYRSSRPSGENAAVLADAALLQGAGHEVVLAKKDSDRALGAGMLASLEAAGSAIYSLAGRREAEELIASFRPDVAHLHNLLPLWSPSVYDALRRHGVPSVQLLHNYRLSCLNGSHMLDGSPCFRCMARRAAAPGVVHRCYNDSLAGSATVAISRMINAGRVARADRFLAVSETVRRRAVQHGIPADRVDVKPEHLRSDPCAPPTEPGRTFLFVGRLDRNKGPMLLLDAFERYREQGGDLLLRFVGDGPLEETLRERARDMSAVDFAGRLDRNGVRDQIRDARCVVSPALWEEPFGLTVLEAWRERRPAIVTELGAPAEMVGNSAGWVVAPEVASLTDALHAAEDLEAARTRGNAGAERLARDYSPQSTLDVYERTWHRLGLRTGGVVPGTPD